MEKDYLKIVDEFIEKQPKNTEDILSLKKKYDDFIMPNQECYANMMMSKSFLLDDKTVYSDFLKFVDEKKFGEGILANIYYVDSFVNDYFGIGRDNEKRIKENESLEYKHSIKDYKNKHIAMCFERSVLAHNLLKLIGLQSSLILNDSHAYNIIEGPKSFMLYDITNFSLGVGDDLKRYPSIRIIPKVEMEDFLYGEKSIELSEDKMKEYYGVDKLDIPKFVYKGLNLVKKEIDVSDGLNV